MSFVPSTDGSGARNESTTTSTPQLRPCAHAATRTQPVTPQTIGDGAGASSSGPWRPKGTRTSSRCATAEAAATSRDGIMGYPDEDGTSTGSGQEQQEPDPFYDEAADENDAAWADRQRCGRVSDAVLSCPGCFTTLCIDCQRHEKYHNQYRAMFVMNCSIDEDEAEGGGGGRGSEFNPAAGEASSRGGIGRRPKRARGSTQYKRVCCGVCGTEVGALEVEEELFHFYHIFPSNA